MAEVKVDDFKPNSKAYKAGKQSASERIEPIVKASSIVKQKDSFSKKFLKSFLAEGVNDVKEYLLFDCIIPGIKSAILNSISMAFNGEAYRGDKNRQYYDRPYYNDYSSYYSGGGNYYSSREKEKKKRDDQNEKTDYRRIVFYEKDNAERVALEMRRRIREMGGASIAELLALIGKPSDYTDNDYGWNDERDIRIRRISDGFLIDVPEARYLG